MEYKYSLWLHPDDDPERDLSKISQEYLPFKLVHPTRAEYDRIKFFFGQSYTDDEFWKKGTAYLVPWKDGKDPMDIGEGKAPNILLGLSESKE